MKIPSEKIKTKIQFYLKNWSLDFIEQYYSPNFFVANVLDSNGVQRVLKVAISSEEIETSIRALRYFDKYHLNGVRCIKCIPEEGVVLMELIQPGNTLDQFPYKEQNLIFTKIIKSLFNEAKSDLVVNVGFPNFVDRGLEFLYPYRDRSDLNIPKDYVDFALEILNSYSKNDFTHWQIIHGDLHHFNILKTGDHRDWAIIDPHGWLAPKEFELAAFFRNPIPNILKVECLDYIQMQRLEYFVDTLRIDELQILRGIFAVNVLSYLWAFADQSVNCKAFETLIIHFYNTFKRMLN